jgi:N-methylhydantoinase A
VLASAGSAPSDVGIVIHGTTLATNAVIEQKGARTALVTTKGFRDMLATGNEGRLSIAPVCFVTAESIRLPGWS